MMSTNVRRLDANNIERQLARCPALPSLGSINQELQELLLTEQRYTAQIAEIIQRDPSLTSRLLRLVNSVYYGLSTPVNSIEEAVFYLGIRQIRQLAVITPIIEDFQRLTQQCAFPWRNFWQHCIGTAILTREITTSVQFVSDESDYVAGLVHDVGKIVMAWTFPDHFTTIHCRAAQTQQDLTEIETEILGMDHAELGGLYLEQYHLPELIVKTARFHHHPEKTDKYAPTIAAVQIADLLLRSEKIGFSGNRVDLTRGQCFAATGYKMLFANAKDGESAMVQASLSRILKRIPDMLEGMV
jgi:HD-like signal output (HDOD) protein